MGEGRAILEGLGPGGGAGDALGVAGCQVTWGAIHPNFSFPPSLSLS